MESTALLVIDAQVGAFDGLLIPAIDEGDLLLMRTQELIDAARCSGVLVVFVQHCESDGMLVSGTDAWEIHPSIAPRNDEPVVRKQRSSAFDETDLASILAGEGIHSIVICGLQSEHCVFNTTIGALERGLTVYLAGDAHSTWATQTESATAIAQRQNQALADRGAIVKASGDLVTLMLR